MRIQLLAIAIMATTTVIMGQTAPERGDNLIVISTGKTISENMAEMADFFRANFYLIESLDLDNGVIVTAPKTSKNNKGKLSAVHHVLTVYCSGDSITIKPLIELPTMALTVTLADWNHRTSRGDFNYLHWANNFGPLLESYPGAVSLYYSKQ